MRSVSGISILSIEDNTNNRPIIGKYLFMYFINNLNILILYVKKKYDNNEGFSQFYKIFIYYMKYIIVYVSSF